MDRDKPDCYLRVYLRLFLGFLRGWYGSLRLRLMEWFSDFRGQSTSTYM